MRFEVDKWFWNMFLPRVPPFSPASVIPPVHPTLIYIDIILIRRIRGGIFKQILAYYFGDGGQWKELYFQSF